MFGIYPDTRTQGSYDRQCEKFYMPAGASPGPFGFARGSATRPAAVPTD